MPFPTGWPPRFPSTVKSLRFYVTGTATANFSDRAYLFGNVATANPYTPLPVVAPGEDVSDPAYGGPHNVAAPPIGTGYRPGDLAPMAWAGTIQIMNYGASKIFFSFDGTTVQGEVPPATASGPGTVVMRERREAGIAVNGAGNDFTIMAW